jgi:hypothetical protein
MYVSVVLLVVLFLEASEALDMENESIQGSRRIVTQSCSHI